MVMLVPFLYFRSHVLLRLVALLLVALTVYLLVFQRKLIRGLTEKYVFITGQADVVINLKECKFQ
jgi:hypothetical protein